MRSSGWFAGAALVATLALSGCGAQMTDEEQYDSAREVNFAFKDAVAQLQLQVFDGEWDVTGNYGQEPDGCGGAEDTDSYRFWMGRFTPQGWRLDRAPAELADEVAAWMEDDGWTDVKLRTYSGDITNVVVEAKKPDAHVGLVVVDIKPGESFDTVSVRADSTCEPGNWMVIGEQMDGPAPKTDTTLPATEHPTDPPAFGRTDEGEPRYRDESDG